MTWYIHSLIKVVKLRQISIFIVNRINSLVSLDIENDLQVSYLKLYSLH